MRKKLITTILAVCMILAMLPAGVAYGEENEENIYYGGEFTCRLDTVNMTATIDRYNGIDSKTKVTIPVKITKDGKDYTVTHIGRSAFSVKEKIEEITFASGSQVKSIGSSAFYKCTSLKSIIIPESVTSIEDAAFQECNSLTEINIPKNVESIASNAFFCSNLTTFTVDIDNEHFFAEDGILFSKDGKTLVKWPQGKEETKYEIPEGVETIARNAFYNCKLETIQIPSSVTKIKSFAFTSSSNLKNVQFAADSELEGIENNVFMGCTALINITIPKGMNSIGNYAFAGCKNLTSITIPASVTTIDEKPFNNCDNLTTVIFEGTQEEWEKIKDRFPTADNINLILLDLKAEEIKTDSISLIFRTSLKADDYTIQYRIKRGENWSEWQEEPNFAGLTPDTKYRFEAKCTNKSDDTISYCVSADFTTAKAQSPASSSSSSSRSNPVITVTGGEGGSVVYDRLTRTITITPKEGYFVEEVSVGGEAVTVTEGTMVLENIYGRSRVAVSFAKIPEPTLAERAMDLKLSVRTVKTKKGNVKVTVNMTEELQQFVKDAEAAGYKVYYKYCRSVKESSKYIVRLTKAGTTYINTEGVKGKKYYYKVRVLLYDRNEGSFVSLAESNLKQCRYGTRTWSK